MQQSYPVSAHDHNDPYGIIHAFELGILTASCDGSYLTTLNAVMDKYPHLPQNVFEINIELVPDNSISNAFLSTVLNDLIQQSRLRKLTLRNFKPDVLISTISTLRCQKNLQAVDFQNNSLATNNLLFVLRSLPAHPLDIELSGNRLTDESKIVRHFLMHRKCLKSVKMLQQADATLSEHLFLAQFPNLVS